LPRSDAATEPARDYNERMADQDSGKYTAG
jgi:hypothetical protein